MANTKQILLRLVDRGTEKMEECIMSIGLLSISLVVFANVVARYFFNYSFTWSEELARYIVVWVAFLGISSCARYDGHVVVDLLPNQLHGISRHIHKMIITFIMMALSAYMTYISYRFTVKQFQGGNTSIAIAVPIWLIYLSTVIGFLFSAYIYLHRFIHLLLALSAAGREEKKC
ncbi:MAG: TRAP transporter small permease [Spirochaetia bacterium]|nr:TRAP transporter small permease [Spirochaetia bacterium]